MATVGRLALGRPPDFFRRLALTADPQHLQRLALGIIIDAREFNQSRVAHDGGQRHVLDQIAALTNVD